MENLDGFCQNFSVEVLNIELKENGIIYYKLQCELKDINQKWILSKRFNEFEELHLQLGQTTYNLPYLPPKSLFKLQESDLKKRKSDLQKYLRSLILRTDIVFNEIFTNFIQLDKYQSLPNPFNCRQLGSINNLNMNVLDIHYEEAKGVIFILVGEINLKQRVAGFLYNLFGTNSIKSADVQGRVMCYQSKNQFDFQFAKLWEIQFYSTPQTMAFDEKLSILAVGLFNGDIHCFRVQVEKNYQNYEDYCIIKRHTDEVTSLYIDCSSAQVYSVSKDKSLVITNITNSESQYRVDEKMLENQLTALCVDSQNERMFIGDSVGNIFIYSTIYPYQHITSVKSEFYSTISSIFISKQKNYILFGFKNGNVRVYELKKKGSDIVINPISILQGPEQINSVFFNLKHREIYANCQKNILILSSAHNQPICIKYFSWIKQKLKNIVSINSHKDVINKIKYSEERSVFVTCSKDQTVKFWKYRGSNDDKENEYEQQHEDKQKNKSTKEQKLPTKDIQKSSKAQQQQQQQESDSDEEIYGWDK